MTAPKPVSDNEDDMAELISMAEDMGQYDDVYPDHRDEREFLYTQFKAKIQCMIYEATEELEARLKNLQEAMKTIN